MRDTAFKLYLVFITSWFLHLGGRLPILGLVRFDLLLVCAIMLLIVLSPSDVQTPRNNRINQTIILLIGFFLLAVPFVEWPGTVLRTGLPDFLKAVMFYYFTATLVTSESKLRKFLAIFILCQAFRVLEPLYLHLTQGYWGSGASMEGWEHMDRLSGAPLDVINPNGLAFVVLTVLCFAHYILPLSSLGATAYLVFLPLSLWVLVLTGSRSGMVGLVATFLAIWWHSRRKVLLAAAVAIAVAATIPYLNANQLDRYLSIVDSNTKNAATAEGRIEGWQIDFDVAMRRPIVGHGLGTSREANANFGGRDQPSHNLYTEVLEETGFVGLLIFVTLLAFILLEVRRALMVARRTANQSPLFSRLVLSVQAWLWMNLLFSLASYGLSSYEWYLLAGLARVIGTLQVTAASVPPAPAVVRTLISVRRRPVAVRQGPASRSAR